MELKVGMYVKFKKEKLTYVRKLLEIVHNFETFNVYRIDKEYFDYEEKDYFDIIYPDEILKASYDIIDLIEVGDHVNGQYVVEKFYDYANEEWNIVIATTQHLKVGKNRNDIKSIVTKEQFESMSYKVD